MARLAWLIGLGILVILFILTDEDLVEIRWRPDGPAAVLHARVSSADLSPVEGLALRISRSHDGRFWSHSLRDAGDSDLGRRFELRPIDDERPFGDDWFAHGPLTVTAKSSSHGTVRKAIESFDVALHFEAPATLDLRTDPPFDPDDLDLWRVWIAITGEEHRSVGDRLSIAERFADGVVHLGPMQPGDYDIKIHRAPRPLPGGGTYGRIRTDDALRVTLVSGRNEVVVPRPAQ